MNKPKEKWWSVKKFDVGRELANPDYVQWADERIAALEAEVAKFIYTNTGSLAIAARIVVDKWKYRAIDEVGPAINDLATALQQQA